MDFPITGATARKNFGSILSRSTIKAKGIYCLHRRQIKQLDPKTQRKFKVSCFTETPLDQIKHLIAIPGRSINFEPYGFVFKKSFILEKGGQPTAYINNYSGNCQHRAAFDKVFDISVAKGKLGRCCP